MKTEIIYEDRDILICRKPAGLATQSASVSQPDVVSELRNYLRGAYLGVIHRLDQPVEGLLAFARNKRSAAALSRQLEDGTLNKRYRALVLGHPARESGELADYLCRDGSLAKVVSQDAPGARKAILQYQVRYCRGRQQGISGVDDLPEYTCLDIHIDTGRFHQIRCQLSHAAMPILGDRKYGTAESLEAARRLGIRSAALCACSIVLRHPASGEEVSCEISPYWEQQG